MRGRDDQRRDRRGQETGEQPRTHRRDARQGTRAHHDQGARSRNRQQRQTRQHQQGTHTHQQQGTHTHQQQGTQTGQHQHGVQAHQHRQETQIRQHHQGTQTRQRQQPTRGQTGEGGHAQQSPDRRPADRHWTSAPGASAEQPGQRGDENGYRRRGAGRYVGHGDAQGYGGAESAPDHAGQMSRRTYGGRRSTPHGERGGNPREGSQRGNHSVQGVSGHVGGQFGDRSGETRESSERRGHHSELQFGGEAGGSARDRRYGSRRGHGSQRREDPRVRSNDSR